MLCQSKVTPLRLNSFDMGSVISVTLVLSRASELYAVISPVAVMVPAVLLAAPAPMALNCTLLEVLTA